jgi:hypothetical protein
MFAELRTLAASSRRKKRIIRHAAPEVMRLEERRLLSSGDLTTTATVTTITNGVAVVQPQKSAYATNANSVQVNFTTSDPDDTGAAPTTHFTVTDITTGNILLNNVTGTSFSLSNQDVYQVQFWSTNSDESERVNAHSILIAIDRTAPLITIDSVTPNVLWPPNHKFVTVTLTGVATDSLSGVNASTLRFHVVDEYGQVEPSGTITKIVTNGPTGFRGYESVDFSFQVMLQASRLGTDKDGRHYTIDVTAGDIAGNASFASAVVVVPHDMGKPHGYHKAGQGDNNGSQGHRQGDGSSSHSGGKKDVGTLPGSGDDQESGDGNNQGNGSGHNHGNGNGHGKGGGNGNGDGNGNGHGKGHG